MTRIRFHNLGNWSSFPNFAPWHPPDFFLLRVVVLVRRCRPPLLPAPLLDEAHVLQVVGELRVPPDVPHEADVVPVGVAQALRSKEILLYGETSTG